MKKSIVLILVLVFMASILGLSGCAAVRATNQAKEMLIEYFDYYNDGDIDECVEMFGKEIEDEFDNDDDMEIVFNSFRYTLGEVEYFKVTSFDSDSSFSEAEVVLGVEIEYENLDDVVYEEYVFHSVKGDMEIVGIDYMEHALANQMIAEYYNNSDDIGKVKNLYIPYIADNHLDADWTATFAELINAAAGEYIEHEISDYAYYYGELDWANDIYNLASLEAEAQFERDEFILFAEISIEDDEVGFNYLMSYPKEAYQVITQYYDNIENGRENSMLAMYDASISEDPAVLNDWHFMTDIWFGGYGSFIDYEILDWDYGTLTLDNKEVEVYKFYTYSYYDGLSFNEEFVLIKDKTTGAIIDHWMDVY